MNATDEDRFEIFESRLRELQWSFRFLLVITILLVAYSAYATSAALRQRSHLIDGHGNFQLLKDGTPDARLLLYKGDFSSGIKLYDSANEQRATLATSGEGSALDLRDAGTRMRIMARVSDGGPQLLMADDRNNVRVSLNVLENEPRLVFFDAAGEVTFDTHDLRRSPAAEDAASAPAPAPGVEAVVEDAAAPAVSVP